MPAVNESIQIGVVVCDKEVLKSDLYVRVGDSSCDAQDWRVRASLRAPGIDLGPEYEALVDCRN